MALIDLLIVVLLLGAGTFAFTQVRRADRNGTPVGPGTLESQRMADEIRELRARIQVLERVITDNHGSADLSHEIERLRDR